MSSEASYRGCGSIAVIGAGPAGLTAAYELCRHGITGTILEADNAVGGISRTVERDGFRFDLGGHRFFSKVKEIEQLWDEMLGEPMLTRQRQSRILYEGKFFDYPLKASNALQNLGVVRAARCMLSYLAARVRPTAAPENYEQWVINQFGAEMYRTFFKSYTEKVWGMSCSEISADWAAQRIKTLNLGTAVRSAVFGRPRDSTATSLIDSFRYPACGPGQLWQAAADGVTDRGWILRPRSEVVAAHLGGDRITSLTIRNGENGNTEEMAVSEVISSMPLVDLIHALGLAVPPLVRAAAETLSHRAFLTVALVIDEREVFSDNWIYIHAPEVSMGRIQNYKNWSPEMVPDPSVSCLGLEYFVNEGDDTWVRSDEELVELGVRELSRVGLTKGAVVRGYVQRVPKAYPLYDRGYQRHLQLVRDWLATIRNLQCIGRNGQHRYNNQDHSMATALIAARNLLGQPHKDPWSVNQDAQYHEIDEK